jgi:uncharacterized OsmC-like protein
MNTATATLTTPATPVQPQNSPFPHVVVRGSGRTFLQEISAGTHHFQADEPTSFGGTDAAPDTYDYLMASLGACTSMMVGLQARKRRWPLENIDVSLTHSRIHAHDCEECLTTSGMIERIEVTVELTGPLTAEQRTELMRTAANCPIHRALTHEINVRLRPVNRV